MIGPYETRVCEWCGQPVADCGGLCPDPDAGGERPHYYDRRAADTHNRPVNRPESHGDGRR